MIHSSLRSSLLTIAALGAFLLLTSCKPGSGGGAATQTAPPTVKVAQPVLADIPMFFQVNGHTEPPSSVEIRARVEGFVNTIAFQPGSIVEEGQLLFELDPQPMQQKLLRAKAALADAQASLDKANLDVERYEPLAAQRAIPQQDLTNAQAAAKRAEAAVEAAQADLRSSEIDLGYTEIRAPITGRIGDKKVDVGDLVGRGEPTLLAEVSTTDPIWVRGSISETQYFEAQRHNQNEVGDIEIFLVLPNGFVYEQPGKVNYLGRTVDSTTGSLDFRAEFANPDGLLRPGQFVRLRALIREQKDAIVLPQRAVQEIQSERAVWVVNSDNTVSFRKVETGPRIEGLWIITKGLNPEERVVIEGLQKVREGVQVTPVESEIDISSLEDYRKKNLPTNRL